MKYLAIALALASATTCLASARSWTKTSNCRWTPAVSHSSAVVWQHYGLYTIPSGLVLGINLQNKCWGSSSTAPPWESPFSSIYNLGAVFEDTISGTIPAGKVRSYHWEWKTDDGVQEWTNGSDTHARNFMQDYNCFLILEEINGSAPPEEGN